MKSTRDLLFDHCENNINFKLKDYLKIDKELLKSLNEETKSSSGDKYETSRAMIQIEREKNSKQIKEIENLKKKNLETKPEVEIREVYVEANVDTSMPDDVAELEDTVEKKIKGV